ncbi:FAD-dependent oxidoreductase [Saxibacter everestensis]|uniref:FAD-dependent oxidoreductase n=1 Tax=Saxibacter everestensis TaxID=2909229 RepID=A0ABY8QR98_9MICO|nr:FAD-dependent oxidoreductase [Brevibacteriaceae bacterium ZFBP1038]
MQPRPELPSHVPAVVVGAGYAGLSAALSLQDRGIDVLLLEASDRVGGRVLSEQRSSIVVDHGGQWVGPTQQRLNAWAKRFDCPTFPTWNVGEHVDIWLDGSKSRYTGIGPDQGAGMAEYLEAIDRLNDLSSRIVLDDPSSTPELEKWDSETVYSFLDRTVGSGDARRRVALAVQGVWSCEPRDLSLFHLLFYIASAGSYEQLMETEGCAQERRFVRGAQDPALAVAAALGDRLRLGTRVLGIEHRDDTAIVHTRDGSVHTDRVVLATPPPATAKLEFDPPLPMSRDRWIHRSPMGDVAKVHAVYSTPFWRADGLSGQATLYGQHPVGVVFDNSPPDAEQGVLVAFVYGDRLRNWLALEPEDRRTAVVDTLRHVFGEAAADVVDYAEKVWPTDQLTGGGYAAVPAPGTWFEHGTAGWRTPAGLIHWAGTETATEWNGYIDGAISSGERAAEEVAAALLASATVG